MGGTKTKTIVDLQINKLVNEPEELYKATLRDINSNIASGLGSIINAMNRHFIDNNSLFHSKYLETLGYKPETIVKYNTIDNNLVINKIENFTGNNVLTLQSASYSVPMAEDIALEYIQDNFTNVNLSEKTFTYTDGVTYKYYTSTVISSTSIEATCNRLRVDTVNDYATKYGLTVSTIYELPEKRYGINKWKFIATNGIIYYVDIEYISFPISTIEETTINYVLSNWNNKEITSSKTEYENEWSTGEVWTIVGISKVELNTTGGFDVSVRKKEFDYYGNWSSQKYVEISNELNLMKQQIEKEINDYISQSARRLVAYYKTDLLVDKILVADALESEITSGTDMNTYPIIPLKENYGFVNDSTSRIAILNKIGMSSKDFEQSLSAGSVRNAAIMFIVPITNTELRVGKYLYNILDKLSSSLVPGAKNTTLEVHRVQIKYSDIDLVTDVDMTKQLVVGNIGNVGEYTFETRTVSYEYEDNENFTQQTGYRTERVIRKQINEIYYNEIVISGATSRWNVGGYSVTATLDSNPESCVVPLFGIGLEGFKLEDSLYMLGTSLHIMTVSITEVKTKWYQSGWFKFVMIVALVAITIISAGTLTGPYAALMATMMYVSTAFAVLQIMGIDTGILGQIAQVAGIVTGGIAGITAATATTATQTLATASMMVSLASVASDINSGKQMKSIQNKRLASQALVQESYDELEEATKDIKQGIWLGNKVLEPDMLYMMSSTDVMCSNDILYDYDSLIDSSIRSV